MTLLCGQSSNLMLSLLDLLNSISHMDDIQDVSAQSDLSASGGGDRPTAPTPLGYRPG